jgi:hypothetical protein
MLNKGYVLGKLLAQLEQEGAITAPSAYQLASINPTPVIVPAFTRLADMGKLDAIIEVMNELPTDTFDNKPLSLEDQASFPLGYFQEKARRRHPEPVDEEAQFTAQLLIRLEPSLKEWTMQQGGSKFVRSLLRTQRARSTQ